ncbi:MAG: hypothetical protein F6K24_36010, partial [Okeania sp. SIO2D1]|nr:hypothetical protein [Okeania sp. SIO2D1]
MTNLEKIKAILERIVEGQYTDVDLENLRLLLSASSSESLINTFVGKNIVGKIEGNNIRVGDCFYPKWDDEAIKALVRAIKQFNWQCIANIKENDVTHTTLQSTGIGAIDNIAQYMTNLSQQNVMRYGLKLAFSPNQSLEYFISGGDRVIKLFWRGQNKTWKIDKEIQAPHVTDL